MFSRLLTQILTTLLDTSAFFGCVLSLNRLPTICSYHVIVIDEEGARAPSILSGFGRSLLL